MEVWPILEGVNRYVQLPCMHMIAIRRASAMPILTHYICFFTVCWGVRCAFFFVRCQISFDRRTSGLRMFYLWLTQLGGLEGHGPPRNPFSGAGRQSRPAPLDIEDLGEAEPPQTSRSR